MIRVRDLVHRYETPDGVVPALDGVSFEVSAGQVLAIVGPSGCGKTTLLRALAGLLRPSAGRAEVGGRDVDGPGDRVILVFQEYARSLVPWRTVAENVRLGAHGRADAGPALDDLLHRMHLRPFRDRYPFELSGGMQQRVAFARALLRRPMVLLMDEPFGSLDGLSRYDLQDEMLRRTREAGVTSVIVTHDLDEAVYLADRVLVLSPRPARVVEVVDVALPRERDQLTTRAHPAFLAARTRLQRRLLPA